MTQSFKLVLDHVAFESSEKIKEELNRICDLFCKDETFETAVIDKIDQQLKESGYQITIIKQLLECIFEMQSRDGLNGIWLMGFEHNQITAINSGALDVDNDGASFLDQSRRLGRFGLKYDMYCQFPFSLYIDRFVNHQRVKILSNFNDCKDISTQIHNYLDSRHCENLNTLRNDIENVFLKDVACIETKHTFGVSLSPTNNTFTIILVTLYSVRSHAA